MSPQSSARPTLFCHDASDASHRALEGVGELLSCSEAVVLTVWQPLTSRLVATGGFGIYALDDEAGADQQEQAAAQQAAEEGAQRAREHGIATVTARVEQATGPVWQTIVDVANEIDATMIVCGTRGRGELTSVILGSTAHALLHHAERPVLITPEPHE